MKNRIIISIVVSLLLGSVGGYVFGKGQAAKTDNPWQGQIRNGSVRDGTRFSQGQRGNLMRPLQGEIISLDENGITIKTDDNSTKIIFTSHQTSYSQTNEISRDGLKMGDKIGVFGITNTDGSVSAQNIQLNPFYRPPETARTNTPSLDKNN